MADARELLDIAHSTGAPHPHPKIDFGEVTFPAREGWQVVIFYDLFDLDYIDRFIAPDGAVIELWNNPAATPHLDPLRAWRGLDDTARLRPDAPIESPPPPAAIADAKKQGES